MAIIHKQYYLLKVAAVLLPLVFFGILQGQQYIPNWHLAHIQLDFNTMPPTITNNTAKSDIYKFKIFGFRGNSIGINKAQISTPSQSHSYYCNGQYAFDKNFDTLYNGLPLGYIIPEASVATVTVNNHSVFLNTPDTNIFYLVNALSDTLLPNFIREPLHYTITLYKIDNRLRGGKGEIYAQEKLLSDTLDGKGIYAVRHANGKDWWLVAHRLVDNVYYKILYSDHIERIDTQQISYFSNWGGGGGG